VSRHPSIAAAACDVAGDESLQYPGRVAAGRPRLTNPRRILLGDADAFYVAIARLVDPEGAGRARYLIVGGRTRGVVCSASYEARAMGVRSAMPISRARRLCPQALCVPVPFALAGRKSKEIRAVLERFTPIVQAASIDEWYLDLTGTEALYGHRTLDAVARDIRRAVCDATGLVVSFGGGTSRLLAKLAVERAKPKPGTAATGVFVVPAGGEADFLATVALGDIPMVGPRFRTRLEALGLRTVPDVLPRTMADLERMLGQHGGRWLYERVRGIDGSHVAERDFAKSISREETFARDIADADQLETELVRLVTRLAADLRRHGLAARRISIKLRDADFRTRGASRTLPVPVVTDRAILNTGRALLAKLRAAKRTPSRLLGVALSGLEEPNIDTQLSLFDDAPAVEEETTRDRALARAVDRVRAKFGAAALGPARLTEPPTPATRRPSSARAGRQAGRERQR
jgi:DNA polymerase-4